MRIERAEVEVDSSISSFLITSNCPLVLQPSSPLPILGRLTSLCRVAPATLYSAALQPRTQTNFTSVSTPEKHFNFHQPPNVLQVILARAISVGIIYPAYILEKKEMPLRADQRLRRN